MSKIYSNLDIIGGSGDTNSLTVDTSAFIVTSGGSVGVGVIPTEKFHVVGNTILDGTATITGNTQIDGDFQVTTALDSHGFYVQDSNGRVGTNNTNPQTQLHIHELAAADVFIKVTSLTTGGGVTDGLDLGFQEGVAFLIKGHDSADLRFETGVAGSNMILEHDTGNFGVNTVAPDEKLHVVGSIKMVDGNEALGKVFKSDANGVGSWELLEGGSLLSTSFVSKDGDDATGAVGDPDFPFLTIQAAIDPTPSLKTVFVYPGTYAGDVNYDSTGSSATRIHLIDATINGDIEMKNLTYLTSQNKTGKVTGFITLDSPGASVCYIRDLDEIYITGTGTEVGISSGANNRLINIDNVNKIIGDNVGVLMNGRTSLIRNVGLAEKINNATGTTYTIFHDGAPNRIENCNFNNTESDGHIFLTSTNYNTVFKNCQFECDGILNRNANNFNANEMTFINSSFKSVSQEIFNNTVINAKFFNCTFESNSGETYVFVDGGAGDKTLEFYNCISNKTLYDGGNGEFIVIENGNYVHSGFTVDHDFSTEQDT